MSMHWLGLAQISQHGYGFPSNITFLFISSDQLQLRANSTLTAHQFLHAPKSPLARTSIFLPHNH
jgi:hypothetical protein